MDKVFTEDFTSMTVRYISNNNTNITLGDFENIAGRRIDQLWENNVSTPDDGDSPTVGLASTTSVNGIGIARSNVLSIGKSGATKIRALEIALIDGGGKAAVVAGSSGITVGQYVYLNGGEFPQSGRFRSSATYLTGTDDSGKCPIGYALSTATAGQPAQVLLCHVGRF